MRRIPKSFRMGPHKVSVKIVTREGMVAACKRTGTPYTDDTLPHGLTDFEGYVIYVQRVRKGFTKHLQRHTFWHEYFHMLFWCVGRERLALDETLVDNLGAMQLQAFQTVEV